MIRTVREYDRLRVLARRWAEGDAGLLVVLGAPGTGKSRTLKSAAGDDATIIEGQMSALGLYEQAYYARGGPIIIDDIDGLYSDENKLMLLKCLCQTDDMRRVAWHTASRYLDTKEIPREFTTNSPVCIIANEWKNLNRNVAAIMDRGVTITFNPSPTAVHAEAGTWFTDREIYDYIGQYLNKVTDHSLRTYVVSRQLKKMGDDWREAVRETLEVDPKIALMIEIMGDSTLATREAQEAAFKDRCGGSRATFHRFLTKLRKAA